MTLHIRNTEEKISTINIHFLFHSYTFRFYIGFITFIFIMFNIASVHRFKGNVLEL